MVSKVGNGNPGFELPEQADREARRGPLPEWPQGDHAELGHRELGTWLNTLPPSLQDALHRVFRAEEETRGREVGVMEVLDRALNLNGGGAGTLLGTLGEMSREDAEAALKALADLLRHGVVGYEYREVNGQPMKVFIDVAIGSDLHRAPLVRGTHFDEMF